jgi:hypothetical protein
MMILLALLVVVGCQSKGVEETPAGQSATIDGSEPAGETAETFSGVVVETMDAGGYTYVLVHTESGEEVWAAGPQQAMEVDDIVVIKTSMAMPEFRSETLERTFDMLYFVTDFGDPGAAKGHGTDMAAKAGAMGGEMPAGHPSMGGGAQSADEVDLSDIVAADQTIAAIFADKDGFSGKPVKVRGKVIKSLSGIMGKNWMHIQDGTGEAGTNDLTITSDTLAPEGAIVLVEGTLALDRDFGSGYKYDVIIENAKVTVE